MGTRGRLESEPLQRDYKHPLGKRITEKNNGGNVFPVSKNPFQLDSCSAASSFFL